MPLFYTPSNNNEATGVSDSITVVNASAKSFLVGTAIMFDTSKDGCYRVVVDSITKKIIVEESPYDL